MTSSMKFSALKALDPNYNYGSLKQNILEVGCLEAFRLANHVK